MLPDKRHGTVAGYNRIPCRERCCRDAMARYRKGLEWDAMNGRPRVISALGTRRRIEALMALGWSGRVIGTRLGMTGNNLTRLRNAQTITATTAKRISTLYDELSMTLPVGNTQAINNVRGIAARRRYLPPLAWDDIDDPNERPRRGSDRRRKTDIDPVVVERVLTGEAMPMSKAEKHEVVRLWVGSLADLERLTGIKPDRYSNRQAGAA